MIRFLILCSLDRFCGMVDVYNYIIRVVNILTFIYPSPFSLQLTSTAATQPSIIHQMQEHQRHCQLGVQLVPSLSPKNAKYSCLRTRATNSKWPCTGIVLLHIKLPLSSNTTLRHPSHTHALPKVCRQRTLTNCRTSLSIRSWQSCQWHPPPPARWYTHQQNSGELA